ncbi:MAG: adenylate cyclase, partial [Syntrophothermus sp.]
EYEYEIPADEAGEMLDSLCEKPVIEKVRHNVKSGGMIWEVDVFEKENEGLIIAELETDSVHTEFSLPEWAGAEVTEDSRYSNSNLVKNPYSSWEREKA